MFLNLLTDFFDLDLGFISCSLALRLKLVMRELMIQARVWSCRKLMGNHCTRTPYCRKAWSCICCCSSRNKTQAWCQKGSCSVKGKVHPVSRIENWEEKITEAKRNGKILVVNFKASWCLPCKKIAPIYQELASTYTSMIFVTIDVEELAVSNQQYFRSLNDFV